MIVTIAIIWSFVVRPPEIQPPEPSTSVDQTPSTSQDDVVVEPALVRKEQFYNILLLGCDDGHGNADTIMVASYDIPNQTVGLVSVPRDTMIDRTWSKFPKLNAAYGHGGVDLMQEEISATLGIPIDYYVKVDLGAFEDLVNAVGGLDFYVPEDMYHDDEGGFIIDLKEGQQHLDGHEALQLVRYRGYNSADIGRTEMQQQVLKALAKEVLSWGSISKVSAYLEVFNENVETDLTLSEILYFAQSAMGIDMAAGIKTQTLPGRGDASKNGYEWCYELSEGGTVIAVNELLNPYTTLISADDMTLAKGESYIFANG